jgi:hypothetical protein
MLVFIVLFYIILSCKKKKKQNLLVWAYCAIQECNV